MTEENAAAISNIWENDSSDDDVKDEDVVNEEASSNSQELDEDNDKDDKKRKFKSSEAKKSNSVNIDSANKKIKLKNKISKKYFLEEAEEGGSDDDLEAEPGFDDKSKKDKSKVKSPSKKKSKIVDEDDDDDDEDEDDDNYNDDGFIVNENDDEEKSNRPEIADDDSEDLEDNQQEKKQFTRLKKRKDDYLPLDDEDYLLIQDNSMKQQQRNQPLVTDEEDDNVIAPIRMKKPSSIPNRLKRSNDAINLGGNDEDLADAEEDDVDDELDEDDKNFLVKDDDDELADNDADGDDGYNDFERKLISSQKSSFGLMSSSNGPSIDQIQDAREIFGDAFEFDDLDDDDDGDDEAADEDKYDDELDESGEPRKKRSANAEVRKAAMLQKKQDQILANLRNRFDRNELVATFCTSRDDDIRRIDRPERYQDILAGREIPTPGERELEASWIAHLLISKGLMRTRIENKSIYQDLNISHETDEVQVSVGDLKESIENVLKYIQEDNLEIPFIYTYRRDYLHPSLDRKHLWFVLTCDEKWEQLMIAKSNLIKLITGLQEASKKSVYEVLSQNNEDSIKLAEMEEEIANLQEDLRVAKRDEDDIRDLFESNTIDLEEVRIQDQKNLDYAVSKHQEIASNLKQKQLELTNLQPSLHNSLKNLKFHPNIAKEVLRLFPIERYLAIVENSSDEVEIKDIAHFLDLLIKGVSINANAVDDSLSQSSYLSSQKTVGSLPTGVKGDRYSKYLHHCPKLREFAELIFPNACQIGDAIRHGITMNRLPIPSVRVDVKALEYCTGERILDGSRGTLLPTEKNVINAVELIISMELLFEPSIRKEARQLYRQHASISTRPTKKGLSTITPFSNLFGIHYLDHKPISDLLSARDATLYIRLCEAQAQDLLTIRIHAPGESTSDSVTGSIDSEAFIKLLGLRNILQLEKTSPSTTGDDDINMDADDADDDSDINPIVKDSWNKIRDSILQVFVNKHLIPSLEQETKRELLRVGRENIIEEASQHFSKLLQIGPYRPIHPLPDVRVHRDISSPGIHLNHVIVEDIKSLLVSCPSRPYYGSVMSIFVNNDRQPIFFSFIDRNGLLRGHDLLPVLAMNQRRDKIKQLMIQYKPETIAINISGGLVSKGIAEMIENELIGEVQQALIDRAHKRREDRLQRAMELNLMRHDDEEDEDEEDLVQPNVCIVSDEVALIFKHSPRAKKLFPDLQPGAAAAICLGRYVQEPLAEYCNMWTLADATEQFGYELLFLNLHKHQHMVRSTRLPLLKELERRLVDAVSDVGVDVNAAVAWDHLSSMLAFVPGLGLRKGDALKHQIRKAFSFVENRKDLLVNKLLGNCVYNNAIGFLRIRAENFNKKDEEDVDEDNDSNQLFGDDQKSRMVLNPLDNTRIHPECYITYDFVIKLCGDALELSNIESVIKTIKQVRKQTRSKLNQQLNLQKWSNLWCMYKKPEVFMNGQTDYKEIIIKSSGEELVKSLPIELRDILQELDLTEYLDDLFQSGKGKRRLQCEMIKEELRYPWLDLRVPMASPQARSFIRLPGLNVLKPNAEWSNEVSTYNIGLGSSGGIGLLPISLNEDLFQIITNESDFSLHVGLKVAAIVTDIKDQTGTGPDGTYKRQLRAFLRTTDLGAGLRAQVSGYDIVDTGPGYERFDINTFDIKDHLFIGKRVVGVVVNVNKDRMQIDLSLKPSLLAKPESWWIANRSNERFLDEWFKKPTTNILTPIPTIDHNSGLISGFAKDPATLYDRYFLESEALAAYDAVESSESNATAAASKSSSAQLSQTSADSKSLAKQGRLRNLYHPLFANLDYKDAEERLKKEGKGAGEIIIRPSSKGANFLAITWAFQTDWFKHIDIEERGKLNPSDTTSLGKELYIREANDDLKEPYSDLDEIYSRYVEPMNDYVSLVLKCHHFKSGAPEQVEQSMREQLLVDPKRIPYAIRFEPNKPGMFALTWLSLNANSTNPVKKELFSVRPYGYKLQNQTFTHPDRLIQYFKQVVTANIMKQQQAAAAPLPQQPAAQVPQNRGQSHYVQPPSSYGQPPGHNQHQGYGQGHYPPRQQFSQLVQSYGQSYPPAPQFQPNPGQPARKPSRFGDATPAAPQYQHIPQQPSNY